jgi:glucan phosphoethanolaminetransferase (alkaline phosphatase superfamily)
MKDIVFTKERQKKELLIFGVCFAIGFLMNLISIIIYKTPWYEVFSQLGYVFVIALVLYILLSIVRGVIKLIRSIGKKNQNA